MSIYYTIDGGEPAFLASNRGWADLCRWADGLNAEAYGELVHLCEHGWSQRLPELAGQVAKSLESHHPGEATVEATARELLRAARGGGAQVLCVTDGLSPVGDSEDGETSNASNA